MGYCISLYKEFCGDKDKITDIISIKENFFKNNEKTTFTLFYKINHSGERIRLFGSKFCENNKNKCQICIDFNELDLTEFYDVGNNNYELKVVLSLNKEVTDLSYIFSECSMLKKVVYKKIDDSNNKIFENVTSLSNMFYGCSSLESLPDISNWNTQNVEDMSYMFYGCSSLKEIPDISNWDTRKVTDISNIFSKCTQIYSLPDISKWNTNKVSDMSSLLYECRSLRALCPISNWNTSNVKDMSHMFYNCSSLEMLPYISQWDTSNVENMSYMFYGCSSLKEIDENISKWDTDKVKDITMMFSNCNSLQKVPDISNWKIYNKNNDNYIKNDNINFISQIEEEPKKEEEEVLKEMKFKVLDNQKKLREIKENIEATTKQQVNKKVNEVLEDMCIYGEINKKEIIKEKKKHPEKFIETSEALKLENEDMGLFALGLLSKNLEDLGIKTAIEKDESEDTQGEDSTGLQFITNGMIYKKI